MVVRFPSLFRVTPAWGRRNMLPFHGGLASDRMKGMENRTRWYAELAGTFLMWVEKVPAQRAIACNGRWNEWQIWLLVQRIIYKLQI